MRPAVRLVFILTIALATSVVARAGDTITVKTLTFDDITKRSGTWLFPPKQRYERVLMEYTLKCDPRTTQDRYDCGEWDYLTYTMVTDSTGEFDSTALTQVNYVVRNSTPDSLPYRLQPIPTKRRFRTTTVSRTAEGDFTTVGTGGQQNTAIVRPEGGRARFIWRASELTSAGLTAGTIRGIRLRGRGSAQSTLFTVAMKQQANATATRLLGDDDFSTVIRRAVRFGDSLMHLPFSTNFTWDGTSDLVIDFNCLGTAAPLPVGLEAGAAPDGVAADTTRRAYAFTRGDVLIVDPAIGEQITDEVTIAFWSWGDANAMPRAHNTLEAYDEQDRRVINIHLPWDNGTVYWDCGIDPATGAVDRIEKAAPTDAWEGRWNHWAFVKSKTGIMRVYRNGQLFHEGNGKTRAMRDIKRFLIGSGQSGSYEGLLDEIQVWNVALSEADIVSGLHRRVTISHPRFTNLIAYYTAESDAAQGVATDASAALHHGTLFGMPTRVRLMDNELGYLTGVNGSRPVVQFETGDVSNQGRRVDIDVDVEPRLSHVILYERPVQPRIYRPDAADHPSVATDTILVQQAGWYKITDDVGIIQDSMQVPATATLRRQVRPYFSPIVVWEIGRYITPYGIGLDLGPKGFKWIFDVTDYAGILHDNVTLSAGNQQELIDLTFKFVKGTPPRDVKQIDQLWSTRSAWFPDVLTNRVLEPVTVSLQADASSFRVKTWTSGHEFDNPTNCAEFCQRLHNISVDGTQRKEWLLWTECGDNPVYPQGGTWLIDRAGWCPGAPVDLYDHEITPWVTPGRTTSIDYGIKPDTSAENWGRWDVTGQLIGYGAVNHELDGAIDQIISPSTWEFHSRMNPICGSPIIVIQNRGSRPLTSMRILYGIDGAPQSTYEWSGSLPFLGKDTIALPVPDWGSAEGPSMFRVIAAQPNGSADQYANNDTATSTFVAAPLYYNDVTVVIKTNNFANEQFSWSLRKIDGATIASGSNLESNKLYELTYDLADGCYEFLFSNRIGYGLDFWFLRSQLGTGSLSLRSGNLTLKNFEPDFGNQQWQQFRVGAKPTIHTSTDTLDFGKVLPGGMVTRTVRVTPGTAKGLRVTKLAASSIKNYFTITRLSRDTTGGLDLAFGDTLEIDVQFSTTDVGRRTGTLRIDCNDERTPTKSIRLIGETSSTASVNDAVPSELIDLRIVPNPITTSGEAIVELSDLPATVKLTVRDVIGRTVAVLFDGHPTTQSMRLQLPDGIAQGMYHLTYETSKGIMSTPFVIAR
jgi:hypothetical protein